MVTKNEALRIKHISQYCEDAGETLFKENKLKANKTKFTVAEFLGA